MTASNFLLRVRIDETGHKASGEIISISFDGANWYTTSVPSYEIPETVSRQMIGTFELDE